MREEAVRPVHSNPFKAGPRMYIFKTFKIDSMFADKVIDLV